ACDFSERPHGYLLQADDRRPVRRDELDHLAEERTAARRERVAVVQVPGSDEELRRFSGHGGVAYGRMRVVLADPPAFTPTYDHELAAALVRAGAGVEPVTSRFRLGGVPGQRGTG